ncbi:MAG: hypothetical protein ABIR29_05080 [Chthoniobacterales bacterium]
MSDINIRFDGLLAFLIAAGLGSILVLSAAVCFLRGWWKTKRVSGGFASPNLRGMLLSTALFAAIALTIVLRDGGGHPRNLERWLDRWVAVWGAFVLLLWPLVTYLSRRNVAPK